MSIIEKIGQSIQQANSLVLIKQHKETSGVGKKYRHWISGEEGVTIV